MPIPESGDPAGALLLLAATICILGASLTVCYMIWSAGWEGWERKKFDLGWLSATRPR